MIDIGSTVTWLVPDPPVEGVVTGVHEDGVRFIVEIDGRKEICRLDDLEEAE